MFIIPGEFISLLTFPGIVLHEIAHRFFCDVFNIGVIRACYFQPAEKEAGYVIFERPKSPYQAFFIAIAPLLINSLMCMILLLPYGIKDLMHTSFVETSSTFTSYCQSILTWIGFSIGFNAIPSNQDIAMVIKIAKKGPFKFFVFLFSQLIALFNLWGIGFFFKVFYAMQISLLLPYLLRSYHIITI